MTYRDDHDAAIARSDAAVREARLLAEDNARLAVELARAKEWLGGPRMRILLVAGIVAVGAGGGIAGLVIGWRTADGPAPASLAAPVPPPLPVVYGVIVADGPVLGHWTLNATRCVPRQDGVELTAVGSEDHNIWLTDNVIELETPTGVTVLKRRQCWGRLEHAVVARAGEPRMYDGHVDLDCQFDDNRLQGRIEFRNCR